MRPDNASALWRHVATSVTERDIGKPFFWSRDCKKLEQDAGLVEVFGPRPERLRLRPSGFDVKYEAAITASLCSFDVSSLFRKMPACPCLASFSIKEGWSLAQVTELEFVKGIQLLQRKAPTYETDPQELFRMCLRGIC